MEAHALVSRLVNKDVDYPFLALLISGGHNLLVLAQNLGEYVQLGTTIDDAIGEAYDKSARWLGLDIRKGGGPALEELALEGDPNSINFRVPMRQHKDCNFSYAGLKTQVRLAIESRNLCTDDIPISSATEEDRQLRANIAASFQVVSGGVASNQYVRARLNHIAEKNGLQLVSPPPSLCTDNGVMIAWTGIEHFVAGRFEDPPPADEPDDMQIVNITPMVIPSSLKFEDPNKICRTLELRLKLRVVLINELLGKQISEFGMIFEARTYRFYSGRFASIHPDHFIVCYSMSCVQDGLLAKNTQKEEVFHDH
ncbi:putative tRNA threonylcarbamoyladenosine biosynthesis protein Gcp [Triticum urartu]|uniref:N(6)-L-threonylcarbamoyladenine synthase n=1 Tax=Triticum urartu TaxID=4572 RepID=M7ZVF6_TRIUA|nr:putative tRNA threonylcarbamoyladenosine biosynthesis protein Gcp [Triticum urartu]